MSIANLSDLKTTIQQWRGRSDTAFTNQLDNFVTLFESKANDELPITTAEVDTVLTGTTNSRSISLPTDFLEPVALFLTTYGVEDQLAPIIAGNYPLETTAGPPEAWMINGSNLDLDKPCDQAHTFKFRYRMKLLDLSTTDPNWLLTNHPDVYLYGCLEQAAKWARDRTAVADYKSDYMEAKDRVAWVQSRSKSVAPLRVDGALGVIGSYNINSDEPTGIR